MHAGASNDPTRKGWPPWACNLGLGSRKPLRGELLGRRARRRPKLRPGPREGAQLRVDDPQLVAVPNAHRPAPLLPPRAEAAALGRRGGGGLSGLRFRPRDALEDDRPGGDELGPSRGLAAKFSAGIHPFGLLVMPPAFSSAKR